MKRFVLTGAPGAGKTVIIRQLEIDGLSVVEEAATDVITLEQARGVAEPWTQPSFIDSIANLQRLRLRCASNEPGYLQFDDRSAVCTAALAVYLGHPVSATLSRELERIKADALFEKFVFFISNLGQIAKTEAPRISFEEALRFERVHEENYRNFGFDLVFVEPATFPERVAAIKTALHALHVGSW